MPESAEVVDVGGVPVEVRRRGTGPDVLFVHGIYVNGHVWDDVVALLEDRFTCWIPNLPLGGNVVPASWSPTLGDIANLVPGLIDALGLVDPVVVGNDSGGGFVLLALADPEGPMQRVRRLALVNCDSYDHLPPTQFEGLVHLARKRPGLCRVVLKLMLHSGVGQRIFLRNVTGTGVDPARRDQVFGSRVGLGDAVAATAALVPTETERAMDWLADVVTPVRLLWGTEDKFFPQSDAERLMAALPDAKVTWIPGARTFAQLDDPRTVAAGICP